MFCSGPRSVVIAYEQILIFGRHVREQLAEKAKVCIEHDVPQSKLFSSKHEAFLVHAISPVVCLSQADPRKNINKKMAQRHSCACATSMSSVNSSSFLFAQYPCHSQRCCCCPLLIRTGPKHHLTTSLLIRRCKPRYLLPPSNGARWKSSVKVSNHCFEMPFQIKLLAHGEELVAD